MVDNLPAARWADLSRARGYRHGGAALRRALKLRAAAFGFPPWLPPYVAVLSDLPRRARLASESKRVPPSRKLENAPLP